MVERSVFLWVLDVLRRKSIQSKPKRLEPINRLPGTKWAVAQGDPGAAAHLESHLP